MKEIRYDLRIESQSDLEDFIDWANFVGLKWSSGREIELKDWKSIKNRLCLFWYIDNKFIDFETCVSTTYNCKAIVHYISQTAKEFLRPWQE